MRSRIAAAALAVLLVAYFVLFGVQAVGLIRGGGVAAAVVGVGLLILPLLGILLLGYELRFGFRAAALTRRLATEGGLPDDSDLPRRPSGRVDRDAADARFALVRTEVTADPGDWRRWYRLGHAYDLAGDRRRARSAIRRAIALAGRVRS